MRRLLNPKEKVKIDPSGIQRILLIRLRRIGDVVMTTPAITAVREGFPSAKITYVIDDPYKELVEGHPALDSIIILPKKLGLRGFLDHIRRIRKDDYDVVIDFHGGPRAWLLTLFSGARLKVGYKIKHKSFIYDVTLPREPEKGYFHSVENHINLVKALGLNPLSSPPMSLPPSKKSEVDKIQCILRENSLENTKIVILHISAGNAFRDWGTERLVRLIGHLSQTPRVRIILVGSSEDRQAEREITEAIDAPLISIVSRLNLRELRELISVASLFVGPDSGPMHIAATTNTPIVAYFGPPHPPPIGPREAQTPRVEKDFDCRPCRQRQCMHEDFRCLRTISPEEVHEACLPYLKNQT
jgi:ADP-heptose:LPS heptosyltransferase